LFWKVFDSLEDWFLVITLGLMLILNFANVVSRYCLSTSIAFTEELTTNLFVWSSFIGAAAAAKRGAHLGFDLLVNSLPAPVKRIVAALVTLLTLAMFALLFYYSIDMIETQMMLKQETPALGWPEWIVSLALPVSAFFCFVRFAQAGWNTWQKGGAN
jgi:TRAP-type C4-dicarboxylate transport system permease small subunit